MARVREVLTGFEFMDFKGPVNLKTPDVRFAIYEECERSEHAALVALLTT